MIQALVFCSSCAEEAEIVVGSRWPRGGGLSLRLQPRRYQAVHVLLAKIGVEPKGAIGADDPLLAFDDAIAQFSPSHLLIGLRDSDRAGWQERGLLDALYQRVRVPITVFDLATR